MIAAWMLYCTGIAMLIGAAAVALERTGRLVGRPGRWVWVGAMVATLGLPLTALYRPAAFASVAIPLSVPRAENPANGSPSSASSERMVGSAPRFSWRELDRPLVLMWGALSIALLGFGVMATVRLDRLRRKWRPATVDGTPVFVSASLGPAVVGVVRSRLVIPEWTLDLEPSLRELLLAHEREHIRAGNPRLLAVASAFLSLMPWNVGLWWQWRRLRLAVEMDCDARVLRGRSDPARYGTLLLEVSQRVAGSLLPVAAFHEPMSMLERRIRAITSGPPKRKLLQAIGCLAATALLMISACEAPRPTSVANGPTPPSEIVSVDVMRQAPERLQGPSPVYPPLLLQAGIQGVVIVEAIIDTAGRVEPKSVRIVESPHPGFDQRAKEVVLSSVYRPGRVNGKAVRVMIRQPVSFPEPLPLTVAAPIGTQRGAFYNPSVQELSELAERYHPEIMSHPNRPAAVGLVFNERDSVVRYAAGAPPTGTHESCDAVLVRLLPEFTGRRFRSGGCAGFTGSKVVVYWGSLRRP